LNATGPRRERDHLDADALHEASTIGKPSVETVRHCRLVLLAPLFGNLAAEFPDDAAGPEFAIKAGIGAGLAEVQALLTVP
jgi:hypothetical protein